MATGARTASACDVTTSFTPACRITAASRSSRKCGSSTVYAAPAFSTASTATTSSTDRSRNTPTVCPGAAPHAISSCASYVRSGIQLPVTHPL